MTWSPPPPESALTWRDEVGGVVVDRDAALPCVPDDGDGVPQAVVDAPLCGPHPHRARAEVDVHIDVAGQQLHGEHVVLHGTRRRQGSVSYNTEPSEAEMES